MAKRPTTSAAAARPLFLPPQPLPDDQPQPRRAFIYNRNSRVIKNRAGGGSATDDTSLENRRLCEARGWTVTGEYFDRGASASRFAVKQRDDWNAMIEGVRAGGCDVIVYWEASRGYRNTRTYLDLRDLCEETGVVLCYNGREYDMRNRSDRFTTHLDAMRSEDELEAIRERNRRTTRINAERGRPHGRVPYGYRREYDPQTGELLRQVVDGQQAAVIREAAGRVAGGQSLLSIAARFNARGVPAPAGAAWSAAAVRIVLLRPTNIGKRQFQGRVVGDAGWDPILSERLYYGCLKVLNDPGRLTRRDTAVKYLLSGIALCGPCGAAGSVLRPHRAGAKWSYTCPVCRGVSIGTDVFDAVVEAAVLARLERPQFAAALVRASGDGAVARALEEAAAIRGQLEEARVLAKTLEGGRFLMSAATLASLERDLQPLVEAAERRAQDATLPGVLRRVAGPGARAVWGEQLGLVERRAVLRAVLRVRLNPAGRGVRVVLPERFSWEWLR